LDVIFHLLAETLDEVIGVSNDDKLKCRKHREAAQLVEHFAQLGRLAIDVDPLGFLAGRSLKLSQLFELEKQVAADQGMNGFQGHRDCLYACDVPRSTNLHR
jgi:hypothetical protein